MSVPINEKRKRIEKVWFPTQKEIEDYYNQQSNNSKEIEDEIEEEILKSYQEQKKEIKVVNGKVKRGKNKWMDVIAKFGRRAIGVSENKIQAVLDKNNLPSIGKVYEKKVKEVEGRDIDVGKAFKNAKKNSSKQEEDYFSVLQKKYGQSNVYKQRYIFYRYKGIDMTFGVRPDFICVTKEKVWVYDCKLDVAKMDIVEIAIQKHNYKKLLRKIYTNREVEVVIKDG